MLMRSSGSPRDFAGLLIVYSRIEQPVFAQQMFLTLAAKLGYAEKPQFWPVARDHELQAQ